ncbi:MAG: Smr/MutS family protein [Vicinamibacteria bacterium]|nr:Smr/MutS family protein [Vicinamibacteria bacterium]
MLTIGADVLVLTLKRRGVVVETLKVGVYRVQVGAMTITAREQELDVPAASKKKKRRATPPASVEPEPRPAGATPEPASIDLHGLTVDDARNRVAGYISRAILAGLDRVEIIHGIGTGRLKAAVTKDLRAISAVRAVKPHPTNPGITLVYF